MPKIDDLFDRLLAFKVFWYRKEAQRADAKGTRQKHDLFAPFCGFGLCLLCYTIRISQ